MATESNPFPLLAKILHGGIAIFGITAFLSGELAEDGMQKAFTRSGIAHIEGVAALHHALLAEVVVDQGLDGLDPRVGGDVTSSNLAE